MIRSPALLLALVGAFACTRSTPAVDAGAPRAPGPAPVAVPGDAARWAKASAWEGQAADGGASDRVVRFVALGDTGKANEGQRRVGEAMGKLCREQGCDFVVLLGDNFYPTGVTSTADPQWQGTFVAPYAPVDAPFFAVLGNHDYGGNGRGNEFDKPEHELAYAKVNPKWHLPARHYRFGLGPVDFVVADTNRAMYGQAEDERADLASWLAGSRARWRIAFGHHPAMSNGPHGNAGEYDGLGLVPIVSGQGVKDLLEAAVCGKADLYIAGHDHSRQWLEPTCQGTELVVSGNGSSPTGLTQKNRARFQSLGLGFLYVVADEKTLTGTFYDDTGAADFTRTLTK